MMRYTKGNNFIIFSSTLPGAETAHEKVLQEEKAAKNIKAGKRESAVLEAKTIFFV